MTSVAHAGRARGSSIALLAGSLVLVAIVALIGGLAGPQGGGSWYDSLDKAPWNPPSWVFGPAWTLLYVLMAVAAWLVARTGLDRPEVRAALVLYVTQLALNLAWSLLFFGAQAPGWALVDIVLLTVLVAATIVAFARVSRTAAWLLVPYLAWVLFATTLNLWIVAAN